MTYYVCFAFMLVFLFFSRFDSLGKQLSQSKTTWKPTQRIVQRLIFLFTGSGVLNGQIIPLISPRGKNSDKFVIATTAIIAVILLFITPLSNPAHYITTGGILGKLYSNTMMVVLNNRIVLQARDESIMLGQHASSLTSMTNPAISQRPAFSTSHSGTLVTHKQ